MPEIRTVLIFIELEGGVSALHQNMQRAFPAGVLKTSGLAFATGGKPFDGDDYVLLHWGKLAPLDESVTVGELPDPGILIVLAKEPQPQLFHTALALKQYLLQSPKMREQIKTQRARERSEPVPQSSWRGSPADPFDSAQEALDFLRRDSPEQYVFRGQVRQYPGPLLPSAFRGILHALDFPEVPSMGPIPTAGLTMFRSEIREHDREKIDAYNRGIRKGTELPYAGPKAWDAPEEDYQEAYAKICAAPRETVLESRAGAKTCVKTLIDLLGGPLAMALAQQYGLSSTWLDATTSPEIAVFFATHDAPFYHAHKSTEELGVVYRWPRGNAIVSENILRGLEDDRFQSLRASFHEFVGRSPGLKQMVSGGLSVQDAAGRVDIKTLVIEVASDKRDLQSLAMPQGACEQSRFGRQRSAFLSPATSLFDFSALENTKPEGEGAATVVGDLMVTHKGEAFCFHHTGESADIGNTDKFYLWPTNERPHCIVKPEEDGPQCVLATHEFQDPFLELLFRLFSPWSPAQIILLSPGPDSSVLAAPVRSNVDPGYFVSLGESETIGERLAGRGAPGRDKSGNLRTGPISYPIGMHVAREEQAEFRRRLAGAFPAEQGPL